MRRIFEAQFLYSFGVCGDADNALPEQCFEGYKIKENLVKLMTDLKWARHR